MILKSIRHRAGVRARIDLKAVRDAILVEDLVQLAGIDAQAVLIAHVDGDGAILPQIADVLIDERPAAHSPPTSPAPPAAARRPSSADRDRAADSSGRATMPPRVASCARAKNGSLAEIRRRFHRFQLLSRISGISPAPAGPSRHRQQGLMMYRLPNTSGCFMPMRVAPYPPIEWPTSPRLARSGIVR